MLATGFNNSFTSGEIFPDATDRTDIQPIAKGFAQGTNLIIQPTGPLKKRRGFWWLGGVAIAANRGRLIPFRRSVTDALILELGHLTARVWSADGSRLMNMGVQVQFATPFASADLAALRYRQVADVIYFTSSAGIAPVALERLSDISWAFNTLGLKNGPWLSENIDDAFTWTFTGTAVVDLNPSAGASTPAGAPPAGYIDTGQAVSIVTSKPLFSANNIGDLYRIRASSGSASIRSWEVGANTPAGWFILSVGQIYISVYDGGGSNKLSASSPPVQTDGVQSDGCSWFKFVHDGAGIVKITAVADSTHASGTVIGALPVNSGAPTPYWAQSAYGADTGWPRAWPAVVEERLVLGGTRSNLDFLDLTRTAGFTPLAIDFHPGEGTGQVVATDACRRRLGDDGGEIIWARQATFLLIGTASGEYVVSGGLFGDPISPATIICRGISEFGSADVYPAKLEKGLAYVTTGGQTLRTIRLDLQQNDGGQDVSFLAHHIELASFDQLCYIKAPDRVLWARLGAPADPVGVTTGLAALTIYPEQEVRGWTTQALGVPAAGQLTVEDIVSIPGPGLYETLWMIASGQLGGVFQRFLMMLSQKSDGLFVDAASLYAGAPVAAIGGLGYLNGETVRVVANGVQIADQVVAGGAVAVPAGTTRALVGLPYQVTFTNLKMDAATLGGTLLQRERVVGATVDLLCTTATCGVVQMAPGYQSGPTETFTTAVAADALSGPVARRGVWRANLAGDVSPDMRIQITEDSAYDFGLFAIRPQVETTSGR